MNKYTSFEKLKSYVIKNAKKFSFSDDPYIRQSTYKYKNVEIWFCKMDVMAYKTKPFLFIFEKTFWEGETREYYGATICEDYTNCLSDSQGKELYDIIEQTQRSKLC